MSGRVGLLPGFGLWFLLAQGTAVGQVVLSEVMFDPLGDEATDEFIQLLNLGPDTVDLRGWRIGDQDELDFLVDAGHGLLLAPGQFALVLDPDYFAGSRSYDSLIPSTALIVTIDDASFGKGGLSNSKPETLYLVSAGGDTVACYRYALDNPSGHSDEKIDPRAGDWPENWANSPWPGGTPGGPNSVSIPGTQLEVWISGQKDRVLALDSALAVTVALRNRGTEAQTRIRLELFWDRDADGHLDSLETLGSCSVERLEPGGAEQFVFRFDPAGPGLFLLRALAFAPSGVAGDSVLVRVPAAPGDVRVNEIYYWPELGEPEWVEIINVSGRPVNLAGWRLKDASRGSGAELSLRAGQWWLRSGSYAVIAADTASQRLKPLAAGELFVPKGPFPTLNNSGDSVVVLDPVGNRVDALAYLPSWGGAVGVSLERMRAEGPSDQPSNWGSCRDPSGSTPGRRNSISPPDSDLALLPLICSGDGVGQEWGVSLAVANLGTAEMPGGAVRLRATEGLFCLEKSAEFVVLLPERIAPGETVRAIQRWKPDVPGWMRLEAMLETSDQDRRNNSRSAAVYLSPAPGTVRVNEIQFDPPADEPEWVEVVNRSACPLSLDGWYFGDSRQRVRLDSIGRCVPPGGFALIAAGGLIPSAAPDIPTWRTRGTWPVLNNTGDGTVIVLPNGRVCDSLFYRPEWRRGGRGSLERLDPDGDSLDSLNWAACEDTRGSTPGAVNSVAAREVDLALIDCWATLDYWPKSRLLWVEVKNRGKREVSGASLALQGEEVPEQTVPLPSLAPGQQTPVPLEMAIEAPGRHRILLFLRCPGDARPANDSLRKDVYLSPPRSAVVINELYARPLPGQHEWVELANNTAWDVDLQGWKIHDRRGRQYAATVKESFLLPAGQLGLGMETLAVLDEWAMEKSVPGTVVSPWPSLNDDGDDVVLVDANGLTMDSVSYSLDWKLERGFSLERVRKDGSSLDPGNWVRCTLPEGATPGRENSVSGAVATRGTGLTATPVPFSPNGDGRDDLLLISVQLPRPSATVRLEVYDLAGRRVRTLLDDQPCGPSRLFVWDGRTDAGMACGAGAYVLSLRWWSADGASGSRLLPVALVRP